MVSAQRQELSGIVRYADDRPVSNASVSLITTIDSLVKAYTTTDSQGRFRIVSEGDGIFVLKASKPGMLADEQIVKPGQKDFSFILLRDTIHKIQEVVVTRKNKITVDGDTVSHHVDSYRIGNENVLEEVLSRLPGFEILENGQINVNGKPIQKIMVDGTDLVSSQYTLLSQNLSPNMIEDVQVVHNYLDDPFFRTATRSDDIALNLKFKEEFRYTFVTDAILEGGTVNRYHGKLNNILLGKQTKLYALTTANNIGQDISTGRVQQIGQSSLVQEYRPTAINNTVVGISPQSIPRVEKRRWFDNNTNLFSLNLVQPITKKMITRLNSTIGYNKDRLNQSSHNEYFIPNQDNIRFMEEYVWNRRAFSVNSDLQIDYNLNVDQRFRYKIKIDMLNETNGNEGHFNRVPFAENMLMKGHTINHGLNYVKRFEDKSFISLDIAHNTFIMPQRYVMEADPESPTDSVFSIFNLQQEVDIPVSFLGTKATYYWVWKGNQMVARAGYESTRGDLFSQTELNMDNIPLNNGQRLSNHLKYSTSRTYTELEIVRHLNRKLELRGAFTGAHLSVDRTGTGIDNIFLLPKIQIIYRVARKNIIVGQYQRNTGMPEIVSQYNSFIFRNYRTANRYVDTLYFRPTENYSINYRYNDSYNSFSGHLTLFHMVFANSFFSQNQVSERLNLSTMDVGVTNRSSGINYGVDKLISPLSTSIKFNGKILNLHNQNTVNSSQPRNINMINYDHDASLISSFDGFFNYVFNYQYVVNMNRANFEQNKTYVRSSFHRLLLRTDFRLQNGWYFQTDLSRFRWGNNGEHQSPIAIIDANIQKNILNNKVTVTLSARNLLDTQSVPFNRTNDYYIATQNYQLLNRMLLIALRFKI